VAANWRTTEWKKSIDEFYGDDPQLKATLEKHGMSGNTSHCVQLLNSFIHHGPNGKHFVMVFEILGVNFLEIIKRYDYKGVPIPLVRKLAKQCLIGLDYLHRMCKIIHTDFKPENVVITLRDDEVAEIAKTGQLTTSKLFNKGEHIKRINQKIAGALIQPAVTTAPLATTELKDGKVWDVDMDGLTAKQKKNLRKKLQRQRRKAQGGDLASKVGDEESQLEQTQDEIKKEVTEEPEISNNVEPKQESSKQKKKHVKKGSHGGDGKAFTGLLMDDEDEPV
jgi:serine/threonine-protein kinase SRPK3